MNQRLEKIRSQLTEPFVTESEKGPFRTDPAPFVDLLLAVSFPHFRAARALEVSHLEQLQAVTQRMLLALGVAAPEAVVEGVMTELPQLQARLIVDAKAILAGDPAARSVDEVIIAYPGFFAIAIFRCAHLLHRAGVPIFPRVLTEYAHEKTGIDIHPGAQIGEGFVIDHGTGIVIGETAVVGKGVKIYQGVTLGALSVEKKAAGTKRHPTVEDGVVLYSNATVLGGDTVIGHNSVIGGNVWLTDSVPPFSVVYHKAEVTLRSGSGPQRL
ncbi:MAG: serine acetyltransferase [Proteobacteria bacterium]|nr:serine acetyltransferase [Pseudomonadota bacterium]